MKIESLIKRPGGTHVEMNAPDCTYHFAPTAEDPRHIAEVYVEHHAKALLRIKEAYCAVDDHDFEDDEDQSDERNLKSSKIHNAEYTILGGDVVSLEDLTNMAFEDSGLDEEQWNTQDDEELYRYLDATLLELQGGRKQEEQQNAPQNTESDDADSEVTVSETDADADTGSNAGPAESAPESDDKEEQSADLNSNGITDSLEDLTRDQLEPLYVKKFGRKPSSKMRVDDIKRALSEQED